MIADHGVDLGGHSGGEPSDVENQASRIFWKMVRATSKPLDKRTEVPDARPGWRPDWAEANRAGPAIIAATDFETGEDMYGSWLRFEVGGVAHRMRWIPPGTYTMGSPEDEEARDKHEGPQHEVTLDGFWMGETAVPQALWKAVMGKNPSRFTGDKLPVETVSWKDCIEFLSRLITRVKGLNTRLPTEAEWEYACRGGTSESRYSELDAVAWHKGNSGGAAHSVGQLLPNAWGLYDMLGNVWERCSDWYGAYSSEQQVSPTGPAAGVNRVIRGGSWGNGASDCRAACRFSRRPSLRALGLGVRLARGQ